MGGVIVAGSWNISVPVAPDSGMTVSWKFHADMTSFGGLSLTTLTNIGPEVRAAHDQRRAPTGSPFPGRRLLGAPPAATLKNTKDNRSFFMRQPFS